MTAWISMPATKIFEQWLSRQVEIVKGHLRHKHVAMGQSPFCFLRATYYRWAQQFAELDAETSKAPTILAVGDLASGKFRNLAR